MEYKRNENSLRKYFVRAVNLLQKFNTADYENDSLKTEILAELLGTSGSGISIERNFHCDLGYNIHVGDNFYAGFNCTILDMAEEIGRASCRERVEDWVVNVGAR